MKNIIGEQIVSSIFVIANLKSLDYLMRLESDAVFLTQLRILVASLAMSGGQLAISYLVCLFETVVRHPVFSQRQHCQMQRGQT